MAPVFVPTVARTFRAAIKVGEYYVTLEETVTLPLDASDDDIAQAVALGLRIYQAQREAIAAQAASIRETASAPATITMRDPDAPASDKQREDLATLQETLGWSNEQVTSYASEQKVDLTTLTKGQASTLIEGLKRLANEPATTPVSTMQPPSTPAEAEQRFFARYGELLGGSDWAVVQRFLRMPRLPKPTTVDGWLKAARHVKTATAQHAA